MSWWRRRSEPEPRLPADRALFVIGPARSGTTILQNALNHSPDIFLLGEPDLHLDPGTDGFGARYDAMHRAWHNQPTKSSALPPVSPVDGTWERHLGVLAEHYPIVGTKIVVNPRRPDDWVDRLLRFHCARFYRARYLFVFRDPARVLASTRAFQRHGGDEPASPAQILRSIATAVALYTRMVRTMPHVRAIAYEDLDEIAFEGLAIWTGAALAGASSYIDPSRVRDHAPERLDRHAAHGLELLTSLHADLRSALQAPVVLPQLEQNRRHLDPGHLTAIGAIDNRATLIETYLGADQIPEPVITKAIDR